MLDTAVFLESLIDEGYTHLCVVPCSYAKNFINAAINNNQKIEYIPCASEAVACSTAAGLRLSGKRPIVLVQSSGLTNMGSCITSLLLPYDVFFPIIVSWRSYKPGDSEVQHAHLAIKLADLVEAYGYEYFTLSQKDEAEASKQLKNCELGRRICLLEQGTFSEVILDPPHRLNLDRFPKRSEYLKFLDAQFRSSEWLFIGTTGATSREMYNCMPGTKHFYMAGNMGGALSMGLGAFLAGKKVIVCGGDAEFVMHMGGLTTLGRYQELKGTGMLIYLLFDNESNKSTGGQRSYQEHVNYKGIARSAGLDVLDSVENVDSLKTAIESLNTNHRATFITVRCSYDDEMPRPPKDQVIQSKLNF